MRHIFRPPDRPDRVVSRNITPPVLATGGRVSQCTTWDKGDFTYDGPVGFSDLLILAQNYGMPTTHFTQGDFDGDGTVGFPDLLLLAQHYGQGEEGAATSAGVPEPNGLVGLVIAAGLLWRSVSLHASQSDLDGQHC